MVPTPNKDPGVWVLDVKTLPPLSVAVGSVQVTEVSVLPVVVLPVTSLMQLTTGAMLSTDGGIYISATLITYRFLVVNGRAI